MKYAIKPAALALPAAVGGIAWFLSQNFALGVAVFALLLLPALVRLYLPYAQDNPQHLWFKRKLYGWGWTPVTWQGWLTTVIYVALVAAFALTIDEQSPPQEIAFTFLLPFILLTATFVRIAYAKGEKPRWQWGAPSS